MTESGVINKTALVYGQMNEPQEPVCAWALSNLTMANISAMRKKSGCAALHR